MNIETSLAAGIAGGLAGAALMFGALTWTGAFDTDPLPVAVVNLGSLIRAEAGSGSVNKQAIQSGYQKMRQVGAALAKRGYVVLDGSAVINAPARFYVPDKPTTTQTIHQGNVSQHVKPRSQQFDPK